MQTRTFQGSLPSGVPSGVVRSVGVSSYLSYIMLVRVRSLCAICVNITALGVLILWQLLG